jgi:hypothetical protein
MPSLKHPTDRPNFAIANVGSIQIAFSYETMIAFQFPNEDWVTCENTWGPTTGKHLNHINPDKTIRLDYQTFQEQFWHKQRQMWKDFVLDYLKLPPILFDNRKIA